VVYNVMNDMSSHCYVGETGMNIKERADEELAGANED
jgi:hypothetical protein